MQEIAFQSIRNEKFSEWGMLPDPPGGVNPLLKKILDPPRIFQEQFPSGVWELVQINIPSVNQNFIFYLIVLKYSTVDAIISKCLYSAYIYT